VNALLWAFGAEHVIYVIVGIGSFIGILWAGFGLRKVNREAEAQTRITVARIAKLDTDNERMIALLTEIRDRLPPQPPQELVG
jgi:hypothetical protein